MQKWLEVNNTSPKIIIKLLYHSYTFPEYLGEIGLIWRQKTLKLVKSQNCEKNWKIGHFGKKFKKGHYRDIPVFISIPWFLPSVTIHFILLFKRIWILSRPFHIYIDFACWPFLVYIGSCTYCSFTLFVVYLLRLWRMDWKSSVWRWINNKN